MCRFKSGIVLKNRVVLAPKNNNSHSDLLESLNIEDSSFNAMKTFVRIELVPPNDDVLADIKDWKYVVDQDITPDWYEEDKTRYETEFRKVVEQWVKDNIVVICGKPCEVIKTEENKTYYLLCGKLHNSSFGKSNDYETSMIRKDLNSCKLVKELQEKYGDKLVPANEYGDVLTLPSLDLYMECRDSISCLNFWYWLSTGCGSDGVCCVFSDGYVDYGWYGNCGGVRPFFILKS